MVNCPESVDPGIEVAVERDRDMGTAERRHDLEALVSEPLRPVEAQNREVLESTRCEVVDLGVSAGEEAGQAPARPVRVAAPELHCLQPSGTFDEVVATHDDQRISRQRRSADTGSAFGHTAP